MLILLILVLLLVLLLLPQWHEQQLQLPAPGDVRAAAEPPVLVPNMLLLGLDERSYLIRALASVRATEVRWSHTS